MYNLRRYFQKNTDSGAPSRDDNELTLGRLLAAPPIPENRQLEDELLNIRKNSAEPRNILHVEETRDLRLMEKERNADFFTAS